MSWQRILPELRQNYWRGTAIIGNKARAIDRTTFAGKCKAILLWDMLSARLDGAFIALSRKRKCIGRKHK